MHDAGEVDVGAPGEIVLDVLGAGGARQKGATGGSRGERGGRRVDQGTGGA